MFYALIPLKAQLHIHLMLIFKCHITFNCINSLYIIESIRYDLSFDISINLLIHHFITYSFHFLS